MTNLITALAAERSVILAEHAMKPVMGICERLLVLHHGECRTRASRCGPARSSR